MGKDSVSIWPPLSPITGSRYYNWLILSHALCLAVEKSNRTRTGAERELQAKWRALATLRCHRGLRLCWRSDALYPVLSLETCGLCPLPLPASELQWFGCNYKTRGGHGSPLQCPCLESPHRQRSLARYSLRGHKESDMTEWLSV